MNKIQIQIQTLCDSSFWNSLGWGTVSNLRLQRLFVVLCWCQSFVVDKILCWLKLIWRFWQTVFSTVLEMTALMSVFRSMPISLLVHRTLHLSSPWVNYHCQAFLENIATAGARLSVLPFFKTWLWMFSKPGDVVVFMGCSVRRSVKSGWAYNAM